MLRNVVFSMHYNGTSKVSLLCLLQRIPLATCNSLLSYVPCSFFHQHHQAGIPFNI